MRPRLAAASITSTVASDAPAASLLAVALLVVAGAALTPMACTVELAGLRCDGAHACIDGYACVDGQCLIRDALSFCTGPAAACDDGSVVCSADGQCTRIVDGAEGEGVSSAEGEGEGLVVGEGEGEGVVAAEGEGEGEGIPAACTSPDDLDGDQHGIGCPAPDCNEGDPTLHTFVNAYADEDEDGVTSGSVANLCTDGEIPLGFLDHKNGDDNCADIVNPDQLNDDGDAPGNECDNCPFVANDDQVDSDGDGAGDLCDTCFDVDGDRYGVGSGCLGFDCDDADAAVSTPTVVYVDEDGDGVGFGAGTSLCVAGSTVPAGRTTNAGPDNCPFVGNAAQGDVDVDGIGDVCDPAAGGNTAIVDGFDGTTLTGWTSLVGTNGVTGAGQSLSAGDFRQRDNGADTLVSRAGGSDVVIDADETFVDLAATSPPNHLGVIARLSNAGLGYACIISRLSSSSAEVQIVTVGRSSSSNATPATVLAGTPATPVPVDGSRYQVHFALAGPQLTCTVTKDGSGTPITTTATDATLSGTNVGLYARRTEMTARFFSAITTP